MILHQKNYFVNFFFCWQNHFYIIFCVKNYFLHENTSKNVFFQLFLLKKWFLRNFLLKKIIFIHKNTSKKIFFNQFWSAFHQIVLKNLFLMRFVLEIMFFCFFHRLFHLMKKNFEKKLFFRTFFHNVENFSIRFQFFYFFWHESIKNLIQMGDLSDAFSFLKIFCKKIFFFEFFLEIFFFQEKIFFFRFFSEKRSKTGKNGLL